ncbi:fatty acid transporter protein [Tothia fuscella]|uniref:Very long-chain fatty acid transport protein n=1 Tax=Tothia fuscella TaxID=1048955 RepID=A0A9P4U595_9PEZI|nr:fatty acid transporter protein [Tothia fuscella]
MTPKIPLTVGIPAAVALFQYLDAKFHIRADLSLLGIYIKVTIQGTLLERKDLVSPFYVLEKWALSPTHSTRTFLVFGGKSWTYRQTYENVLKYGTWMKERWNVQKGEIVAMDFVNSEVFVFVWFGLWSIGAKPAFINYNLQDKPLLHCVKTSSARVVFADEKVRGNFEEAEVASQLRDSGFRTKGGDVKVCFFDAAVRAEIEATEARRLPDEERGGQLLKDMAILIYTSGTTGLPKPAVVSWAKAGLAAKFVAEWTPLNRKDDVLYTCMPLYHSSAALLGLLAVLSGGSTLSLGEKFSRATFWSDCRATNATAIQYVGETCRYLLSAPPSPLDKQHKVRLAFGNGLRPDIWPTFKERFNIETVQEFYGATEGPAAMWNQSRNSFTEGAVGMNGAIAKILVGAKAKVVVLDFETNTVVRDTKTGLCIPVRPGEPGELVYKLDEKDIESQFQGYYGNNKASSSKILRDVFVKGDAYFSTGDVMRKDSEGRWFFCDRIGDTFRWKSENVSTAEVAEVIGKVSSISEANVYGVEIPQHDGRAGCAALTLNEDVSTIDEKSLQEVAQHAFRGLPRYAVPLFLRIVHAETAAANRTGTNKQQKHNLRNESVDPAVVTDELFWLPPGSTEYKRFTGEEWKALGAGTVKL